MTGGFRATELRRSARAGGARARRGLRVAYRDTRRFGTWLLTDSEDADRVIAVKNGPEPLERGFTAAFLGERLAGRTRAAQGSDPRPADASPGSGTSTPTRRCGTRASTRCARPESSRLDELAALRRGDPQGARARHQRGGVDAARLRRTPAGSMQHEFRVYGRGGEPCERCGTPIAKTVVGGRRTSFCPDRVRRRASSSKRPSRSRRQSSA